MVDQQGLCRCLCVCIGVSALECHLLCMFAQIDTASGPVYDSGCPNLWKQWVVSNQSEPWGFRLANYNVQWLAAMVTLVGRVWGLQGKGVTAIHACAAEGVLISCCLQAYGT